MALVSLYAFAIFIGAGLLFLVQPLIAKVVLPQLGGSPAVWNTCMVFFQAMLLGGYLYADRLTRIASLRKQVSIHAVVLLCAALLLPIGLPDGWHPPGDGSPVLWLLTVLLVGVGGPFLVLASASPLLQRWFAETGHPSARDPYFLYAASNAGSMLALLGYPLLVEPWSTLTAQRWTWSGVYIAFAAVCVACGWVTLRRGAERQLDVAPAQRMPIPLGRKVWWVVLALLPSSLLLGVTQHITTDVATFPLLWVVPLAVYLLTFIIAFTRLGPKATRLAWWLVPVLAVAVGVLLTVSVRQQMVVRVVMHLSLLFSVGLLCHGQLAIERPPAASLTTFYLLLSVGGVLGGALNALVAPLLFDGVTEYPLVIGLAVLVRIWADGDVTAIEFRSWRDFLPSPRHLVLPLLVFALYLAGPKLASRTGFATPVWGLLPSDWLGGAVAGLAALTLGRDRLAVGLATAVLLAAPMLGFFEYNQVVHQERTFFGVYRVKRDTDGSGHWHHLWHGTTKHGTQYSEEPWASKPTTYYTRSGPFGDLEAFLAETGDDKDKKKDAKKKKKTKPRHIALVGLGVGTIASYGRPEWRLTYYEIDPAVVRIASDEKLYTYISKSKSKVDFRVGDARLKLAEAADGSYDAIVLDAFSSDAVPIHLLTREAMALYAAKLKPDGVLFYHLTNLYLNLDPVVGGAAQELGLTAAIRTDNKTAGSEDQKYYSRWAVVGKSRKHLDPIGSGNWLWLEGKPDVPVWTDDYSNILRVLY